MKFRYPYTRSYRDRHGKLRIEFRRKGKTIPLRAPVGTAEFQAEYDAAKALVEDGQGFRRGGARSPQQKPGTLRWLCVEYFKSEEFQELGPITQEERRRILEHTLREPSRPGSTFLFADYPVTKLEHKHIRVLRDRKKSAKNAGNHRIKALRVLFKWAIENDIGGMAKNPARDVSRFKVSGGYPPWTEEERELFKKRHPVGTMARLAYELFFHTGQRLGDVRDFGPRHVRNGKLCFTQEKNRRRKPVNLELPIQPELQQALDATPHGDLRFLVTGQGRPFASKKSFGNWFGDRCREAGLADGRTAHGLRSSAATFHADLGATATELQAIFGWRSLRVAEMYVRAANQKRNAERAMARALPIKGRTSTV